MPPMEDEHDGPLTKQVFERDEMTVLIGHREERHFVAHVRGGSACLRGLEPSDEIIDFTAEVWRLVADDVGDSLQTLGQCDAATADALKDLFEPSREGMRHGST